MSKDELSIIGVAFLIALVIGAAAGLGFGVAFNIAAGSTFDRAERLIQRVERAFGADQ